MFWKIRKFQKNIRKLYFARRLENLEGGDKRSHRVGTPPGGAGPPLAAPACGVATLAYYCHRPFAYFIVPAATSAGQKTPEREKLSGRQKSAGEIPSRRGEIVAIVIIIALDFIRIIITIILTTSTFISTITTPSRCNILS
jgi:hypothetical protein